MDAEINNSITLGYVNKNLDLNYIESNSFEACIIIPEDLIFVSLRENTAHIFDPVQKFPFSNIERSIIGCKGSFDMRFLKNEHYRKANSKFCPVVPEVPVVVPPVNPIIITDFTPQLDHDSTLRFSNTANNSYPLTNQFPYIVEYSLDNENWILYVSAVDWEDSQIMQTNGTLGSNIYFYGDIYQPFKAFQCASLEPMNIAYYFEKREFYLRIKQNGVVISQPSFMVPKIY